MASKHNSDLDQHEANYHQQRKSLYNQDAIFKEKQDAEDIMRPLRRTLDMVFMENNWLKQQVDLIQEQSTLKAAKIIALVIRFLEQSQGRIR